MNYYLNAIKNKYAQFSGRARRAEFWQFALINALINIVLNVAARVTGAGIIAVIGSLYALAVLVPGLAVGVRRMHDINKDWWYILIPFYNIYLWAIEGEKGTNQYGPDPKGITATTDTFGTPPSTY